MSETIEILKPYQPMKDSNQNKYFYPLTHADQVVCSDGQRLGTKIDNGTIGGTSDDYLPLSGGTMTGNILGKNNSSSLISMSHIGALNTSVPSSNSAASAITVKTLNGSWGIGAYNNNNNNLYFVYGSDANYSNGTNTTVNVYITKDGYLYAPRVYNAVWNDYAEYREADTVKPGYVLCEVGNDSLTKTKERLSHFAGIVSDTYGAAMGETDKCKTPIAVAGRVLVYPAQDRNNYKPGDCVCAAPGGLVDIMTREEVQKWPDRIVGTVSCIPQYETWGKNNIPIDGRIWIKVK